ncbi:zf-HC2 domain-containing protein [Frankia sp. AgPm24]|uniref:anti-sigma factor family protein n=1 Tax=Frankia sp. AgPm24 TaxID=631128 RepID=UPI00200FE572|nr:zf-HC2 domain-containing protein [Frankia sp. AgPm24]MCK9925476.1 zf-HC2 domain-containing protein [Frankia sp. AgPm24]
MTPEHDEVRFLLGAFVLGGLEVDDRNAVDAHLAGCPGCRAELEETASVPALLRRLPGPAGGGERSLDDLLQRVRAERRSVRRTRSWRLAAVAAVLVLCAGIGLVVNSPAANAPTGQSVSFVAAAGTTITGRATLTSKPWGTSLAAAFTSLPGSGPFALEVASINGTTERAASWSSTPTSKASVVGASSIQTDAIDVVRAVNRDGLVLAVAHPRRGA